MNTTLPLETWTGVSQSSEAGTNAYPSHNVIQWAGAGSNRSEHEAISINVPSRRELLALVGGEVALGPQPGEVDELIEIQRQGRDDASPLGVVHVRTVG